jgi:hypothetical protein
MALSEGVSAQEVVCFNGWGSSLKITRFGAQSNVTER